MQKSVPPAFVSDCFWFAFPDLYINNLLVKKLGQKAELTGEELTGRGKKNTAEEKELLEGDHNM